MDLEDTYALGLDLGTTFSCIGVYRNGEVEIIPNRNGDRITPSIITIADNDTILKGEETLSCLVKNYDSTVYAIKRFIGRKFDDKKVQEDIKKENFPFKLVGDPQTKNPLVEVHKNNKTYKFTLEEISSFVIQKLVDNAKKYLNRKVTKLVITVPANFNQSQRNCTKQAAQLAGIEVLRIINEPTAAALAYGLQDKQKTANGRILVFDLGGGTFDVTILSIKKGNKGDEEEIFEVESTDGDTFLGGENFDNKLVNYFIDCFCSKTKENKVDILKNKKIVKNLKISCENVKKILSNNNSTSLNIINFYNNKDLTETITREKFEEISQDLFDKLEIPLNNAMKDAKITKNEIEQIVLVGGSTRIPKIKRFLKNYFGSNCIINDSINPDEAVAYGATIMAAKIIVKSDKILSGFNLFDITPLSLGIAVVNQSKDPDIKKEGDLMSVIIKRASKIPYNNSEKYETSRDNQTVVSIEIYEGEKKYVKYNHILGELFIKNIPPKPKGEVKIKVNFFIDVNGILTVTATELSDDGSDKQSLKTEIEYQSIGLNKEKIEQLKEKNKKYNLKTPSIPLDFNNTREVLNDCEKALKETTDQEEIYNILMTYNNTYEEFIDNFDQNNFDNETMLEKFYLYLKELFESYAKVLNITDKFEGIEENKNEIIQKIKKYISIFTLKSTGYLNNLLDILQKTPKNIFWEIIIETMEQMNNNGKKCLEERKEFCRYNCLMFFENSFSLFQKYIGDVTQLTKCFKIQKKGKEQIRICMMYINEVKTGSILLLEDSIKLGKLIKSNNTGFTNSLIGFKFTMKEETEKNEIILQNYEKMLREIEMNETKGQKPDIKKAMCIANIVKISHSFLGKTNTRLLQLCQDCDTIAHNLGINEDVEWYKELHSIYKEIKDTYDIIAENTRKMREKIKEKYKTKFDVLESKYVKKKNNIEFIKYILEKHPYKNYEDDKKQNKIDYTKEQELLLFLSRKYHPDNYKYTDEEDSQLNYCMMETIAAYLNNMYEKIA